MWDFRFYEASAQILPVLYLAVLVEYRLLQERWEDRGRVFRAIMTHAAAWLAIGFMLGEFQALDIVSRGEVPAGHEPVWILVAYLLAVLTLVWPLWDRTVDAGSEFGRARQWLIFFAGLAAFTLIGGFVRVLI
jgi:hypothetical protein